MNLQIRQKLIIDTEAALWVGLDASLDLCSEGYNIVVGQRDRVILGDLFVVDAGAMHRIGVLDEYSLHCVSSVQYHNGESGYIPTNLQLRVKIEACMVAGHDIAIDPAVVCSCYEVLQRVLRGSPDRDGLIIFV